MNATEEPNLLASEPSKRMRKRLRRAVTLVTITASLACALAAAYASTTLLVLALIFVSFVRSRAAPSHAELQNFIDALHNSGLAPSPFPPLKIHGYQTTWLILLSVKGEHDVRADHHLLFRDEIDATTWRSLKTRLNHGSAVRVNPKSNKRHFGL